MTEPAAFDAETTPFLSLAGQRWPIEPVLTWGPLSRCRAQLIELNAKIRNAIAASPAPEGENLARRVLRQMAALAGVINGLPNEDYERLVMGPIHAALAATHPKLKREELDGWPLTEAERQEAWLTVRRCSGLFVFAEASTGDDGEADEDEDEPPGEAQGAA